MNATIKAILTFLQSRFGDKSPRIQKQVEFMDQPEILEDVLVAVNTLEEARRIVQDGVNKSTSLQKLRLNAPSLVLRAFFPPRPGQK